MSKSKESADKAAEIVALARANGFSGYGKAEKSGGAADDDDDKTAAEIVALARAHGLTGFKRPPSDQGG